MAKKRTSAKSSRGLWLGVLVALLLVGSLLFFTGRPTPPTPMPSPPAPTLQTHTLALGSYGATVRIDGALRALEIRPLAELAGPPGSPVPTLPQSAVEAVITNTLLSYPQLDQLDRSATTQRAFRRLLEQRLTKLLPPPHGRWKLRILRLKTQVKAIPAS